MKRPTMSVPASPTGQTTKKIKLSPDTDETETATIPQTADNDGWTKVEKRKQKKAKKSDVKLDAMQPKFMYSNGDILQRQRALGVEEIRDLALHLIADAPPPNWIRIQNAHMIPKVVVILVPGLTPDILGVSPPPTNALRNPNLPVSIPLPPRPDPSNPIPLCVPFISSTFSHACPTRAPGDQTKMHSVLSTFFNLPISGAEKKRRIEEKEKAKGSESGSKDPSEYILTVGQMIENEYPIPSYMADVDNGRPFDWAETPQEPKRTEHEEKSNTARKVYGIDCEMCMTEDGKELTRVCVMDYDTRQVLYDQLVKPSKPITDYLTRWSGITAEALATATTTFSEAQARILQLLSPIPPPPPKSNPFSTKESTSPRSPPPPVLTPILVGHSLESDLKALKIAHPFCIDTALLYSHPRGRPLKPGLAWLTKKWCGKEIQNRGEGGHDPEEDARATIELLWRKVEGGKDFGEFGTDLEGLFDRMGRAVKRRSGSASASTSVSAGGAGVAGEKIRTAVVDVGANVTMMHGSKANTSLGCADDEEVVRKFEEAVESHDFLFVRLMGLASVRGWITPRANNNSSDSSNPTSTSPAVPPPAPLAGEPTHEALSGALQTMSEHLKTIHAAVPPRTALLIFTGHSDPRRMSELSKRKAAFETAIRKGGPSGIGSGGGGGGSSGVSGGVSLGVIGKQGGVAADKKTQGETEEIRWTAGDMRELEEAVELAKRGLFFVGVKS
ncbi:hypothetical protein D9757_009449 [Collybiopsis confluens]|uniref:Exonuclease domain-containing protein n=1 Tax=Collybiopsis confluens TaxID=2823264 RepID=A0A8H5HDA0_9AGAR|nr:hypothetical protein D9757_009449 [Collybiopsis confluens]